MKINIGDIAMLPRTGRITGVREDWEKNLEVTIQYSYEMNGSNRTCSVIVPIQIVESIKEDELHEDKR